MCEPFIGQIAMFAGNFAPRGWAFCDGQLLRIAEHTALFALIGTTYGGDGRTTFALPDLRGRVPIHPGDGPDLTSRRSGERGGQEHITLTAAEMPSHSHIATAAARQGDTPKPSHAVWAGSPLEDEQYAHEPTPGTQLHPEAIQPSGGGHAHDNMQPYLCVNFIIALQGFFPSREHG
jgi:microcystin-dependent protein